MGTTHIHGATRKDVVAILLKDFTTSDGDKVTNLKHCTKGNVLWTVKEIAHADGTAERVIGCDLLSKSKYGWGYKPMDETMGPYYFTCPLAYLELAGPTTSPYAKAWRERVKAYHAKTATAAALVAGAIAAVTEG